MLCVLDNEDYWTLSRVITFPETTASEDRLTVSVSIANDDVFELNKFFIVLISEIANDPDVQITQPMAKVEIIDDDSKCCLANNNLNL